jgi:hypothetical protein
VDNAGATTWSGGNGVCGGNGGEINNLAGATFEAQSDATLHSPGACGLPGPASFNNSGTFRKTAGTGTDLSGWTFTNSGVLDIQTGTVRFGTLSHESGAVLQGRGTLGVSSAAFTNAGKVNPGDSPGILTVTGDYPTSSTAVLNIEIGGVTAGTNYDQLAVTGTATLGGTLNVTLINGFAPPAGQQFTIMTYAAKTGDFATINLPAGFTLNVTPTAVIVVAPAAGATARAR